MVDQIRRRRGVIWKAAGLGAALAASLVPSAATASADSPPQSYIVADSTSGDASQAAADVNNAGGQVVEGLPSANAVLALLTGAQAAQLAELPSVTVTPDGTMELEGFSADTASGAAPAAVYPQQTGATQLWAKGNTGNGINVAVIDTGIDPLPDFAGRLLPGVDFTGEGNPNDDQYGHGTFVAGLIAGNGASSNGQYMGEAPGAGLVPVKVAGPSGQTDVATVIQGVDWVIAHAKSEKIRVVNLSLGWFSTESSTVNPLDQAVERAWDAGIVVVVSAGNEGPFNGTILSPGDDPLAITVGAVNDHGSASPSADSSVSFSSVGPSDPDGWYKPDIVTSGTSVVSLLAPNSTIAAQNPQAVVGSANFVGSGTSFSSAITAGAAALLLRGHSVSPDDVKADLLGSALAGPTGDPFVDGHGVLNIAGASANKFQLKQNFGQVAATAGVPGGAIQPGQTIQAGYKLSMPGKHAAASTVLSGGQLDFPVSCNGGGATVGVIEVDLAPTTYNFKANSGSPSNADGGLQGSATADDFCNGAPMYQAGQGAQVVSTGAVISNDTTDPAVVSFQVNTSGKTANEGADTAIPVAQQTYGQDTDLGYTWLSSTWNPSLWNGLPSSVTNQSTSTNTVAPDWDGHVWNGSVWNGHVWNGHVWNGHVWNGHVWNGNAWDGHVWNGSVWNGHVWNGNAWGATGSTYDGSPLPGTA